jgi:hypothetical protein
MRIPGGPFFGPSSSPPGAGGSVGLSGCFGVSGEDVFCTLRTMV